MYKRLDIVSASDGDDTIAWYENDGAANPSWTASDISTCADVAFAVFLADLDNDGDFDIVMEVLSSSIKWNVNNKNKAVYTNSRTVRLSKRVKGFLL